VKILITGTTGRIGRAAYVRLCAEHQVLGLDRAPSSTADVLGDLSDETLLRRALQGVQAVIHTGALHAPQVGQVPDAEFERINVAGTATLARLAAEAGVGHIVFTSTTALYGDAATPEGRAGWVDETLTPQPRTIYHRSKLAAEALLRDLALAGGPAVTVIRMSRCFPEPAPLMAAYRLHRGIDARDVAQAQALAIAQPVPGWRVFVISGATPFEPADAPALWHDAPAVLAQRAPALVQAFAQRGWALPQRIDRVYSPALARQVLGWQPRYGFAEVLHQLDALTGEVLPVRLATG
jgi:UDP-glucose 4-epimerase